MNRPRSPRYPAVSLTEAINGVHLLWTKDKKTALQGEQLAKALGYRSHSGPARTLIGAMRQYGLLEKQGKRTRLSDNAKLIVRGPEGSEEQAIAIREAALTPPLFRDLYTTHRNEPDDAIKSYLRLRRGFTGLGAALAASAYRDTLSVAGLTASGNPSRNRNVSRATTIGMPGPVLGKEAQRCGNPLLTQTLMISIPRNLKVDVIVHGDQIEKEDIPRMKNQLIRWIEGLEDAFA